jgi:hypothetical protein
MRLGENSHLRHAAIGREMMHVHMQQSRTRLIHASSENLFDMRDIVDMLGIHQIDDEMRASETDSVPLTEIVLPIVRFRLGGTRE